MNANAVVVLLFLSPLGVYAAAQFVVWLTKREDRAAERKRSRLRTQESGKPV